MLQRKTDWEIEFKSRGVRREGEFTFYSGRKSNVKYDFDYLYKIPSMYSNACQDLLEKARLKIEPENTIFVGPERGGISIAYELARQCGAKAAYTRKTTFSFELDECFRPDSGNVIVLCDDVLTTGKSFTQSCTAIGRFGARVSFCEKTLVFVNRSGFGKVCLWPHAHPQAHSHNRDIIALVETNEPGWASIN